MGWVALEFGDNGIQRSGLLSRSDRRTMGLTTSRLGQPDNLVEPRQRGSRGSLPLEDNALAILGNLAQGLSTSGIWRDPRLEVRAISGDGALIEGIHVVPSISLAAHEGMTWMISDMASPALIETESLLTIMTERGCLFLCKHTVGITRTIYTTLWDCTLIDKRRDLLENTRTLT